MKILDGPWCSISIEIVVELPPIDRKDAKMVVVDRFSKMAKFIPCATTTTAADTINLFISHVFSKHGLPQEIVSDRGPQFTSQLWEWILSALKIKPCQSTAFHPQLDGQTERVNQIMETYLCCYASSSQDTWLSSLPLAEFAYNNLDNNSAGASPFFVNYGFFQTFLYP